MKAETFVTECKELRLLLIEILDWLAQRPSTDKEADALRRRIINRVYGPIEA